MSITAKDIGELVVNVEAERLWTENDFDVFAEYYTDDFVYHSPDGEEMDLAGYEAYARAFHEAFPDAAVDVHQTIVDGNTTASTFTYRGTWEGEFRGMEPNGSGFEIDGIAMERVEDGRIAEIWRNVDSMGMMTQLGVVDLSA